MGNVYATSDWHGCGNIADKVLKFLKSDDTLFFLGDAIDRGPDGLRLMNTLLNDKRVIYIKGNHEDWMEKSLKYILSPIDFIGNKYFSIDDWLLSNGGQQTWKDLEKLSNEDLQEYVNKLNSLKIKDIYCSPKGHTVLLEHAGYSPFIATNRIHDPLWDRNHFYDSWTDGCEKDMETNSYYIVHGHTPVQYLTFTYGYKNQPPLTKEQMKYKRTWFNNNEYKPTIIHYCDNHKIDIDMCTICSNRIALLNLDTFEEIYFD